MADADLGKAFKRAIVCVLIIIFIPVFAPIFLNYDPIRECLYVEEYVGSVCLRTEIKVYFLNMTDGETTSIKGDSFGLRGSNMYRITSASITNLDCKTCTVPDVCKEQRYLGRISVLDIPTPKLLIYEINGVNVDDDAFNPAHAGLCKDPTLTEGRQESAIPRHAFESSTDTIGWKGFMITLMVFAIFGIGCIACGKLFLTYLMSKT